MDIWRQCGETKGILNALPVSRVVMGDVSTFVTGMGDYCYMLGQKIPSGTPVTGRNLEQIGKLHEHACRSTWRSEKSSRPTIIFAHRRGLRKGSGRADRWRNSPRTTPEYPHLVYDGPTETATNRRPQPEKQRNGRKAIPEKTAKAHVGSGLAGGLERMDDLKVDPNAQPFRAQWRTAGTNLCLRDQAGTGKCCCSQTAPHKPRRSSPTKTATCSNRPERILAAHMR